MPHGVEPPGEYCPELQPVHTLWPVTDVNVPGAQETHDAAALAALYCPTTHGVHALAPSGLYCPALHADAVLLVEPAAQAYPAAHGPLHDELDSAAPGLP